MGTHDKDTNDLESPLGIAQEPISDEAKDHLPEGDPSKRRSRARALGEDGIETPANAPSDPAGRDGAPGIDSGPRQIP
jgi:hypothetical protein